MIGIKCKKPAGDVLKTCMDNGLLVLTAKDKVRLLPALNIDFDVLKKGIDICKKAISRITDLASILVDRGYLIKKRNY